MDASTLNINNSPVYQDYTKSASESSSTNRNSEFDSSRFQQTLIKSKTDEQKSTIVTEKLNNNSTSATATNLRLQPEAPVSQMNNPDKTFNESQKNPTIEIESDEYAEFVGMVNEPDTGAADSVSPGKGNYIVVDSFTSRSSIKRTKSPVERFRDKMIKTYNLDYLKAPGTLVNLVF
jgi:hypothetical protein